MNKRQKKKRDKKLYKAIIELNQMVADDLEEEFEWGGIPETFEAVKSSRKAIEKTFADYRRYILNR